jgi:hypothetical protein
MASATLPVCQRGCGRPCFTHSSGKVFATCCTHCKGPDGPHAADCEDKANKTLAQAGIRGSVVDFITPGKAIGSEKEAAKEAVSASLPLSPPQESSIWAPEGNPQTGLLDVEQVTCPCVELHILHADSKGSTVVVMVRKGEERIVQAVLEEKNQIRWRQGDKRRVFGWKYAEVNPQTRYILIEHGDKTFFRCYSAPPPSMAGKQLFCDSHHLLVKANGSSALISRMATYRACKDCGKEIRPDCTRWCCPEKCVYHLCYTCAENRAIKSAATLKDERERRLSSSAVQTPYRWEKNPARRNHS